MKGKHEVLFFWPDVAKDVDEELASHLEMREEELIAQGIPAAEARWHAERRFGNIATIARECREIDERWYTQARRARMWTDLRQDVSYGVRLLARAPGFAAIAIVTLALGIGGSTGIFSVIDSALLRPLPYPDPEQLVRISVEYRASNGRMGRYGPSVDDVEAWRAASDVVSHVTIWRDIFHPVIVDGPELERLEGFAISEDFLPLHGVRPMLGRGIVADDTRVGAPAVVMLGYSYWSSRFGGDASVVGRTLRIDNVPATIVGVAPAHFYPDTPIWKPYQASRTSNRGSGADVYARLRPGVTIEDARQRLVDVVRTRDLAEGRSQAAEGLHIVPLLEEERSGYLGTTKVLAGAVGAILLIACINVAGLLLARGATRQPELGVRASLGASRLRLVRQLLVESLVLAIIGGAAGVLLAWITLDALVASIPLMLPVNSPPTLNLRVLGFSAALALVTGLLFGLAPAWTLSRIDVTGTLARVGHRQGSALSRRSGQLLIAAEITLCIVLLAGAALMIRSFSRMLAVDVGFDPSRVVIMEAAPVDPSEEVPARYYPALVDALRGLPGIEAVGAVDNAPLAGGSSVGGVFVDGQPTPMVHFRTFVPGYIEAIGFDVESGRIPSAAETRAELPAALVNEQAARLMFAEGPVLGRQFRMGKSTYQVAGVLSDVRHWGPLGKVDPEVYLPLGSSADRMVVVLRTPVDVAALAPQLRRIAQEIGPRVIVNRIRVASDWLGDKVKTPRQRTILLTVLGGLGFVLALVGIFGMTAYAVARRTHEIGIRMALGARGGQVVGEAVRDALWPVTAGIIAGLFGAALATRMIARFLFDTRPIEPVAFAVVAILVALAAAVAAWIPARRAARVDPVSALRLTT